MTDKICNLTGFDNLTLRYYMGWDLRFIPCKSIDKSLYNSFNYKCKENINKRIAHDCIIKTCSIHLEQEC